jgi:uncharacterized protein YdeI (YjbR/CyaY-like superfamily)
MADLELESGVVHEIPDDLRAALVSQPELVPLWNKLTPLGRNEWICRVTIVKKEETRIDHIERLCAEILEGKRRPCCRPGCPHRRDSAKKWFKGMKDL